MPGGLSIPKIKWPKRKGKEEGASAEQKATLAPVEGRLRKLDAKELLLETRKKEVLRFRLIAKSQFRDKAGAPMRDSLLNPGDQLRVQVNPDDEETALLITLLDRGGQHDRAAADQPVSEASVRAPRAEDFGKAKSVSLGAGDAGPAAADASAEPAAAAATAESEPAAAPEGKSKPVDEGDKLILDSAREAALRFSASLPDYLAQQVTSRFFSARDGGEWQPLDVVTAELAYSNGREEYSNVQIDGRPATRPVEKSGAWSTGEFGTTLEDLMSEETNAQFRRRPGLSKVAGRSCWGFDFTVKQENSHWTLVAPDGRKHTAAYTGSMCVDQETRRIVRIAQRTGAIPRDFPLARAESILEYGYVRIDQKMQLVPMKGENIGCITGGACTRNALEFRNYRKFGAESTLKF